MIKVGVTGGIGSGKTLICRIFEKLGVPVFYADAQAKWLYDHDPAVREALVSYFGEEIYDNNRLKRQVLASKIFNDREALLKVNSIVHPAVRNSFLEWCQQHSDHPYVIEEAAILFETGAYQDLDDIILVYAPKELRIQRVVERDKSDEASVRSRMSYQADDAENISRAGFVIRNDGSALVIPQVLEIHNQIMNKKS